MMPQLNLSRPFNIRLTSERVYVSIAMRRSGQHAIINWICQQLGDVTHFNNCVIRRRGLRNGIEPLKGRYVIYRNSQIVDSGIQRLRAFRRDLNNHPPTSHAFYSFEDFDITNPFVPFLEPHKKLIVIVIVRDPFNWIASRMSNKDLKMELKLGRGRTKLELWKAHVRECLGLSNSLPTPFIPIDFGKWFSNTSHRQHISEVLDLPFSDAGLGDVTDFGGGSSFDEKLFNGRGQEMEVLSRWKQLKDNEVYRSIVNEPEILALAEAYFHFNPLELSTS